MRGLNHEVRGEIEQERKMKGGGIGSVERERREQERTLLP